MKALDTVIKIGEVGSKFYIILTGSVSVLISASVGQDGVVKVEADEEGEIGVEDRIQEQNLSKSKSPKRKPIKRTSRIIKLERNHINMEYIR